MQSYVRVHKLEIALDFQLETERTESILDSNVKCPVFLGLSSLEKTKKGPVLINT